MNDLPCAEKFTCDDATTVMLMKAEFAAAAASEVVTVKFTASVPFVPKKGRLAFAPETLLKKTPKGTSTVITYGSCKVLVNYGQNVA